MIQKKINNYKTNTITIKVVQLNRKHSKYGSVEILFNTIRKHLNKSIDIRVFIPKYKSQGIFKRIYIIIESFFNQGDINHITGDIHFASFFLKKNKTILTILDSVSVMHSSGLKQKILKLFWYIIPLKRVQYITVISEKTKVELLNFINFPEERLFVIPCCISEQFHYVEQKRFNSQKPIILQIGTKSNKNLINISKALNGISCILDIVGELSNKQIQVLKENNIEYKNSINISENEIIQKYINADIISFISTYEGFGIPIIEAQTVGRVVITSNISPMTEVAGKGACFVNPFDIKDILHGFLKVIDNDNYRNRIINEGLKNTKKYNPKTIAEMYSNLYVKVFNESKESAKWI